MNDDATEPRWAALERALRNRPGPEPSASLRGRIAGSVARELGLPAAASRHGGISVAELSGFAAAVLVSFALTRAIAAATSYAPHPDPPAPRHSRVAETGELLQEVVPGLTEQEAWSLARASTLGSDVPPVPAPRGGPALPVTLEPDSRTSGGLQ